MFLQAPCAGAFFISAALALFILFFLYVITVLKSVVAGLGRTAPRSFRHVAAFVGLFLLIIGTEFRVIEKYGSDLPFWDQWDGEAGVLYGPYLRGCLPFPALISSHNEHRVLFTRLVLLTLLELNGLWEGKMQMTGSALLHALLWTALAAFFWHLGGEKYLWPAIALVGLWAILPGAWENTLLGFQFHFYILIGLAGVAMGLLILATPFSASWWLGFAAALAAPFALISGVFVSIAAAGVLVFRALFEEGSSRTRSATAAVVLALPLLWGYWWSVQVAGHQSLHAHSIYEFLIALARVASWPIDRWPRFAVLLWAPLGLLTLQSVRARRRPEPFELILLGFGLFTLLQAASIAYGRAAYPIASRYIDFFGLGLAANGLAAVRLLSIHWGYKALAICWAATAGWGFYGRTVFDLREALPQKLAMSQIQEYNVSRFVRHLDQQALRGKAFLDIPYPDPAQLERYLSDPQVRSVLPAVVRDSSDPLPFAQAGWLGRFAAAIRSASYVMIGFGLALLLTAFLRNFKVA